MKLYTKTGDGGETSLFGGQRLPKDSLRIEAYGTVDELNAMLGVCRSMNTVNEVDQLLAELQNDLFALGADLATPQDVTSAAVIRLPAGAVTRLEGHIDAIEPRLPAISNFILPGGTRTASLLHCSRTVCRRAERLVARLSRLESADPVPMVYLNRLSDLLFSLARLVNVLSGTPETPWAPRSHS